MYRTTPTTTFLQTHEIAAKPDLSHLGHLIGDPNVGRLIAVSTAAVFEDKSLPLTFWGVDNTTLDNGFQGHLYTRANDVLVLRVPHNDVTAAEMVLTSIQINCDIWQCLTGIQLSSPASRFVLASDHPSPPRDFLPDNLYWHVGSLLDAAATFYRKNGTPLLACVLNNLLLDKIGLRQQHNIALKERARITSLLMDKNFAMKILLENGVYCPQTYLFNDHTQLNDIINSIPSSGRYVFKPAGGAAGIGVFGDLAGAGASLDLIRGHLTDLERKAQLPNRFQIQEFIPGTPYGVTGYIHKDGRFDIFEIHEQMINNAGRFTGGKWTPALQAEQMPAACTLYKQMATVKQPPFEGLICIDIIDGKIIEINPRLTASAPMAHILRQQNQLRRHLETDFKIHKIDLNTALNIPYESMRNGSLQKLIEMIWKESGVLVLPQGLCPFGNSRLVFINDDDENTAQRLFVQIILR